MCAVKDCEVLTQRGEACSFRKRPDRASKTRSQDPSVGVRSRDRQLGIESWDVAVAFSSSAQGTTAAVTINKDHVPSAPARGFSCLVTSGRAGMLSHAGLTLTGLASRT